MSTDKRQRPRKLLNLPAWIDVGNDGRPQRCTLIDMSDTGARLAVDDIECLPDKFHLALSRYGRPRQSCNIVWRRHDEVGIEFIASPQMNARDAEGVGALASEQRSLEMFANRVSEDGENDAAERSFGDDGVSARLLRKVSALLAHGLRRGRHPI
jgi:hypothetical protein